VAARLTGERPVQGVTPDGLLALHAAGYRAVVERLGPGRLLDVGCGEGFESAQMAAPDRPVVGVDYDQGAAVRAVSRFGPRGLSVARSDARRLCLGDGTFRWACSSHLIEHFDEPGEHASEVARVLADDGTAFFVTPNEPADFENPFHIRLFRPSSLHELLSRSFHDVEVLGLDAVTRVKEDFARRRAKAANVLALDVFDLRHRIPRSWYIALYTRALPLAYRVMARQGTGGSSGITADDFFVTDRLDDTTLVLFAVARRPRR
jgi:SAM-dependent methyltransferase